MPRHLITSNAMIPFSRRALLSITSGRRISTLKMRNEAEQQSNFLETFIRDHKAPQPSVDYFSSIDWTRKHLENNAYEAIPFFSRYLNERTGENRFMAQTINSDTTLPHIVSLRLKDIKTPESSTPPNDQVAASDAPNPPPELICLMSLGSDLMSHPSIVHGGFQCVIFDEIIRLLILLHHNNVCNPGSRDTHYTVNMTTSYSAPVVAPSDILVRAWLKRREGRKWFAKAEILNSNGLLLTGAESMWVTARKTIH
ncbi:tRNA-His guanylyltransferase [Parahypoxylon ruwenzoriense]